MMRPGRGAGSANGHVVGVWARTERSEGGVREVEVRVAALQRRAATKLLVGQAG